MNPDPPGFLAAVDQAEAQLQHALSDLVKDAAERLEQGTDKTLVLSELVMTLIVMYGCMTEGQRFSACILGAAVIELANIRSANLAQVSEGKASG